MIIFNVQLASHSLIPLMKPLFFQHNTYNIIAVKPILQVPGRSPG